MNEEGDQDEPEGYLVAADGNDGFSGNSADASFASSMIANSGGNQAFNIRNPLLGIYHSSALQGVYPSRS